MYRIDSANRPITKGRCTVGFHYRYFKMCIWRTLMIFFSPSKEQLKHSQLPAQSHFHPCAMCVQPVHTSLVIILNPSKKPSNGITQPQLSAHSFTGCDPLREWLGSLFHSFSLTITLGQQIALRSGITLCGAQLSLGPRGCVYLHTHAEKIDPGRDLCILEANPLLALREHRAKSSALGSGGNEAGARSKQEWSRWSLT